MTDRGDSCRLMPLWELGQLAPGLHRAAEDLEVPEKTNSYPSENFLEGKSVADFKDLGVRITVATITVLMCWCLIL